MINATNLYDIDEKLIGSNTTMRDITDLYEIQKTVEVNEKKLQQNKAFKTAYDHLLETGRYTQVASSTQALLHQQTLL